MTLVGEYLSEMPEVTVPHLMSMFGKTITASEITTEGRRIIHTWVPDAIYREHCSNVSSDNVEQLIRMAVFQIEQHLKHEKQKTDH